MRDFYKTRYFRKAINSVLIGTVLVIAASPLNAQVVLQSGGDLQSLANLITGNGVQILNPVINCPTNAYGTYSFTSVTGLDDGNGLILSTGNVSGINGPNLSASTTTEWGTPGDPFLTFIAGSTSFDACTFEFDIVPVGDTLRFNFVFGSEEYQEYVGTPFNDAFGFFISGPGISGPAVFGGAENIALIPNTTTAVTINNVNNGNPDIGYPAFNSQYFFANPLSFTSLIQYDGWTRGLYAQRVVTPCSTYHLKLVVADVGDRKWDSSVFIDAIESNSITLSIATDGGIDNMIEGCNNVTVTFTRTPVAAQPVTVTYFIDGTATNGVDYPQIGPNPDPLVSKTIVIPANAASASIYIEAIADGLDEGLEYIAFYVGNPLCEGSIQDSIYFFIQDFLEVSIDPPLSYVCLGESLTFNVEDGGVTFNWSPTSFLDNPAIMEPTATPLSNVVYTLTTTLSACIATAESDVRVTNMSLSANVGNVLCAGTDDGTITLNQLGGEEPVEYLWTGPGAFTSTNQSLNGLAPGSYNVIATDRDGCTATLTLNVIEISPVLINLNSPVYLGGSNISCFGADNGQATATVTGGTLPYTVIWNDADAQTTLTATGLVAGTYTVTITDANGCAANESITITSPAAISGTLISRINVACFGQSTGTATVGGAGGNAPYSYQWNTIPPQSSASATGLAAGFYVVTITDINSCTGNVEIQISQPSTALSANVTVIAPACSNSTNGSVSASVSGGTPPYSYAWTIPNAGNTPTVNNVPNGIYTLTVTDANLCLTQVFFSIDAPAPLAVSFLNITGAACAGESTGSALAAASGGTGPYVYSWNTIPPTAGNQITGVPAGTYVVNVTDANGCTAQATAIITAPSTGLTIQTLSTLNPTCNNTNNGEIVVAAQGGTAPYIYLWSDIPPTSGSSITNLPSGTYNLIVTDANGCSANVSYTLTAPAELIINVSNILNVLCNGEATGAATVNPTGGTIPYSYFWNDPGAQTSATASGLLPETYSVVVTDANNCIDSVQVSITELNSPLSASITALQNVACFGENTGQATVTATGGSGSYSYLWNDAAAQQTATASSLAAGSYSVTVSDNNGCATTVIVNTAITSPPDALAVDLNPSVYAGGFNISCAGDTTGTIATDVSGGVGPYTYLWNLQGLETSTISSVINLGAGEYSVVVSDANGCSTEASIQLTEPEPLAITYQSTPSSCFGIPNGGITLQITGGVPAYGVGWLDPGGAFIGSSTSLTNLFGGSYILTIQDANGCTYDDAVTVVQPENIIITVDSLSNFNGFNTRCSNSSDGAIYITPSGGLIPYSFQWNRSGFPNYSNQEDVENVPPAAHEVVVTDGNGCVQNAFITLNGPQPITATFNVSLYPNGFNVSCFNAADGSIEALPQGGTPDYTFTWLGENGYGPTSGNPINNLAPGEYSVLIADVNGCFTTPSLNISSPPPFSISLQASIINGGNLACNGGADGAINLIATGGAAPFAYSWSGPSGFASTLEDIFGLTAGEYCVDVTDSNNCIQSACITLSEPLPISVSLAAVTLPNGANLTCAGGNDGAINSNVVGGSSPYSFIWSGPGNFTAFTQNNSGLAAGTYCLTATDANGCSVQQCTTLISPDAIIIMLTASGNILCSGSEASSITSAASGGTLGYTYSWTGPGGFSSTDPDISGLTLAGAYCLIASDQNGCNAQACINVAITPGVSLSLEVSAYNGSWGIDCNGNPTGFVAPLVTGGTAPYLYSWTGPNGFTANSTLIEGLTAGTYCLQITDANNCVAQECATLTEPDALMNNPVVNIPNCSDGGLASIDLNTSGGTAPYAINWSTGATDGSISAGNGTYTVFVADANGCSISSEFDITLPAPLLIAATSPIVAGGANIGCAGGTSGIVNLGISGAQGITSVNWNGPNGFTSTAQNLTGLAAGLYCAELTDAQGCEAQTCIALTESQPLSATIDATDLPCPEILTGSISVLPAGGVPTYIVEWSGPNGFFFTGNSIANLSAGEYCAEITDANGCVFNICETISEPTLIAIGLSSPETNGVNIGCFGASTGSINSIVTGGTGTYNFQWSGPDGFSSSDQNITNLIAGEYCLVLTDQNGCTEESCITLTESSGIDATPVIFSYTNGFNVSCNGACDGSLQVLLSGGTGIITTSWTGPSGFTSTDLVLTNLCAGDYFLTTEDENGCVQETLIVLMSPAELQLELTAPTFAGSTEIACNGQSNGAIFMTVSGGSPVYTYSWTGPNGFSSAAQSPDNLFAGTYQVVVTDASGCTAQGSINMNEPASTLSAVSLAGTYPSGNNVACLGGSNGSITTTTTGGIPGYVYNWLGPNNFSASTADVNNLMAGVYVLVVQDLNSCVYTVLLELDEPETEVTASVIVESEVLCFGTNTGALTASAAGGSPGYTVQWVGSGGFLSNDFSISSLPAGTYTYAVTDANGCSAGDAYVLINGPALVVDANIINPQCDAADGSITISVSGGLEPYNITWSDGTTGVSINNLTADIYTATIVDSNGCEQVETIVVESTNSLTLNPVLSEPTCFGETSGTIDVVVIQGEQPIVYAWSGPDDFISTGEDINNVPAGDYQLLAIDANGCIAEFDLTLGQPDSLYIVDLISPLFPNGFNVSTFGGSDGSIFNPEISGGSGEYTLYWTGPNGFAFEGSGDLGGLRAGIYRLAVLDELLCGDTAYITLRESVPLELPNGISPNGDGFNDALTVRGLDNFPVNTVYVYNRWGNLLYEEDNYNNATPWFGTNESGELLPEGTYFVIVEIPDRDNLKGYLELRR